MDTCTMYVYDCCVQTRTFEFGTTIKNANKRERKNVVKKKKQQQYKNLRQKTNEIENEKKTTEKKVEKHEMTVYNNAAAK